ncbi:LOW QUALITY PROTEIN: testis-specific Y-encoded-like protein 1 [Ochotona princeps]|uniref:LOW QUALITY PROTEIN: testis-specific Y-encoded-like protein 1 n=1 Tax=Ochotona princeps TaxID=9978 RepID=UPI002714757F|nr:LOW QUALITY PROTEIN: testis-specific Y-encoded-like protein 1 [Ochotona princeps]
MAETAEVSLGSFALALSKLSEEGGVPRDATDCGLLSRPESQGGRGPGAIEAGREEAPPPSEGLEAASAATAARCSLHNVFQSGEKVPETCGAERSESEAMVGPEAEEADVEKCAVVSEAVDEERAEVVEPEGVTEKQEQSEELEVEKPAGDGVEVVKEDGEAVQEEARPWRLSAALRMNPLEAIQQELDTVNAQADRAFQQLEQKFGRMRRHYLERRNYIIQNIPGFWMTAFRNHPQLSSMIRGQDAEMLRYVTNLEVKELRHPRTGCKFKFFFRRNPYFRNKLIVKEYEVRSSGRVVSVSTPIIWRRGHEPQSFIRRNQDLICTFFTWFSDHSLPESDKIAEIIKEDLWPNPLQYYLLREGVRRARRRPIREPVEIPRPFGFQSG